MESPELAFYALEAGKRIGRAVGAWQTDSVNMLEDSSDLTCVWDLRVSESHRGQGSVVLSSRP